MKDVKNELYKLGKYIASLEEIYIYGAGENGEVTYKILNKSINIKSFVDSNKDKIGESFCELPIIGTESLPSKSDSCTLVVAVSEVNNRIVTENLEKLGYIKDVNLFHYWDFIQLFEVYKNNKIYISGCTLSITEKCSLNCEKCSIMTPLLRKPKHYGLEKLISDVDLYFNWISYTKAFNLLGGEPFLYPFLIDIIEYIGANYSLRLGRITLTTNGTIMPDIELIDALKRNNILVTVSDYSKALPYLAVKVQSFVNCIEEQGVDYNIHDIENWIDFGYDYINREESTEKELSELFRKCNMPCRLVQDGKYYFCANSKFAQNAGIIKSDIENEFDLSNTALQSKKDFLAFERGYNKKGYIELCKKCNGYLSINENYIEVAKQCKK